MSTDLNPPWIGALLRAAWQGVRDQMASDLEARGFTDISRAHVSVFQFPGPEGVRPGQLADQLQISKQAVNDLLGDLERLGYVSRETDPADARSRRIRLTARGARLEEAIHIAAHAAEERLELELGAPRFRGLRKSLIEAAGLFQADLAEPAPRRRT